MSNGRCCAFAIVSAFVLAVSVGLTGCSEPSSENSAQAANRDEWVMPLNEFYVYPGELDNYAEQLLIVDCLSSQGYEWPVPWQDTDFSQPEGFNSIGYRLFTVELAKKWGYHFAPPADEESSKLWDEFVSFANSYSPDAKFDDEFLRCQDEVRDDGSFTHNEGESYLAQSAIQAEQVATQDDEVLAATSRWRDCLRPRVEFTVPQDPWSGMPPSDAATEWGVGSGGTSEPSAEEIAAAVADAECRESSGMSAAMYERTRREQQKLVDENRDKLDRIRTEAIEREAKMREIVAENAPVGP
jgi:hypothetical protein